MKKKGFTLIELLVVIAIIAMLMAILMPALSKVKKIAARVVCGTNLKGLGTAQVVYANDYDDEFVVQGQGGDHTWTDQTGGWQLEEKDWSEVSNISVGASLYLLVREADVSPKSFVCPSSDQVEFEGKNDNNLDIVDLWDFGNPNYDDDSGPTNCVSYSYHMPYQAGQPSETSTGSKGRYAADGTRSAAFAVMADKNPAFEELLSNGTVTQANYMERWALIDGENGGDWEADLQKWQIERANAQPHDRQSQNVLFADGHTANEKRVDVGVKNDCIYTQWDDESGETEEDRRKGNFPKTKDEDFAPRGMNDSVLVNDDLDIS